MFNRKNSLKMGSDYSHKFGQGGPLSQDQPENDNESKSEDDLLLEALYNFILERLPNIIGDESVTVDNQIYYIVKGDQFTKFLTIKGFIVEYYPRGLRLIFDEDTNYYIGISICSDCLEIGLIDSSLYCIHILDKTPLSINETTREITKKFDFDKFEVYDSGDTNTDCGIF